ncbi:MAG: hypothetical protein M1817_005807 [Caeruleum heppii]|nr:MAG: hypothetical protein M1817_005807 [Caeruleum heppii]
MGQYRIDVSPNNRAGCKDKLCQDTATKIMKGELRFATMVEIREHQSWQYRHWGCVTPKQIANLKDSIDNNTDLLDGYDEVPEDIQDKIRRALEQGHVDDVDWKGDPEYNRPGKVGSRKRTPKKKANDTETNEPEDTTPVKPVPKKRGRPSKEDPGADEPVTKKTKSTAKATKPTDLAGADGADDAVPPKTKKSKASKRSKTEDQSSLAEVEDQPTTSTKAKSGRKKAQKAADPKEEEASDDSPLISAKTTIDKPRNKTKKSKPSDKPEEPDSSAAMSKVNPPKQINGDGGVAMITEAQLTSNKAKGKSTGATVQEQAAPATKRGRKKKRVGADDAATGVMTGPTDDVSASGDPKSKEKAATDRCGLL